jgi:transposase
MAKSRRAQLADAQDMLAASRHLEDALIKLDKSRLHAADMSMKELHRFMLDYATAEAATAGAIYQKAALDQLVFIEKRLDRLEEMLLIKAAHRNAPMPSLPPDV